jgi:transketolase
MLNETLNKKIFDDDVEKVASRDGMGHGLVEAAKKDDRIVALCADLTESTRMHWFKEEFPERFFEVGITEQHMASMGSGMAAMGKIPFISSYATFSPGRNWEQIRTTICYNDQPVKIIGSHAGVSTGPDGGTHQALEDIAITRVLPNMVVISPCDSIEAQKATQAFAQTKEPTYIRLGRSKTPIITTEKTPFKIGEAQTFFKSSGDTIDIGIVATGALVHKALQTAVELDKEGVKVEVLNLSTIKPLDEKSIKRIAKESGALVTVEEHQIAGGMGSAIAEFLSKEQPTPIEYVGVNDQYGQSGDPEELVNHYKMNSDSIKKAVEKVLLKK